MVVSPHGGHSRGSGRARRRERERERERADLVFENQRIRLFSSAALRVHLCSMR